ncbi:MAG: ABC transporter permease [Aristaeellaceae bacterium]
MSRLRYIIKRLLIAIPTFFGITLLVYLLASMTPSSPLEIMFNDPMATQEQMEAMEQALGLDQPVYIQYLRWMKGLLTGNLGYSYRTNLPVMDMVLERIGPTLLLTGSAMLLTFLIALPLGIMAAYRPYSGWDYISSGISFIGAAMPNFFAALVLIYIFNVNLRWFPSSGMYDSSGVRSMGMLLHHLVLPSCVLAIQYIGSLIRQCRGSMMEVLQSDYVRTARAKGLLETPVLIRHALRNAWIPLVSWFGMQIPALIGGAVVTEQIFGWPGLGSLMVQSINARDYPTIMGITVVIAIAVLIGNLFIDLLYNLLDPRIKY